MHHHTATPVAVATRSKRSLLAALLIVLNPACRTFVWAFVPPTTTGCSFRRGSTTSIIFSRAAVEADEEQQVPEPKTDEEIRREELKRELIDWGARTNRGFQATGSDQGQVKQVIFELAKYNPTAAPAAAYYEKNINNNNDDEGSSSSSSLRGKWTLIFTDAPDITGLDSGMNPLVKLGKIGQDCSDPPNLVNVIEWNAPEWVDASPLIPAFLRGESSSSASKKRILQKVVTKGKSQPGTPSKVTLEIAGLQIQAPPSSQETSSSSSSAAATRTSSLQESIAKNGLLTGLLEQQPVNLQGPLQAPFGEFELLYLDDDLRITRTGQNFFAVNVRIKEDEEAWF